MRCARCQTENREGRRFCSKCGGSLDLACPTCGFKNGPSDEFCGGCGQVLVTGPVQVAETKTPAPESPSVDAERRQLTVMFCDLVDSTRLSERLDPEEFQRVLREYHSVCSVVIRRFEGNIAQYLGDGIVVYFGYPRAHEDDAQRAVRAGLGVAEAIAGLTTRLQQELDVRLGVRLGVHTGLVVVGEMGEENKREQVAMGETPNIAARVQSVAEPGTVVITAATYRLIEGFFDCQELGAHSLKGISQPVAQRGWGP